MIKKDKLSYIVMYISYGSGNNYKKTIGGFNMDGSAVFKEIILVTDGESNVGINPVLVADKGKRKGIIVNTIGIVKNSEIEKPMAEIQNIAATGGGLWEITDLENLSQTMTMMTAKSVYKTIEEVVNKELKQVLKTDIHNIHPKERNKIIEVIDKLGEEIHIKCCIVMDCSGSMSKKIIVARNSILSLLKVMNERKGKMEIALITYPWDNDKMCRLLCDFTDDIFTLERSFDMIRTGGTTPTGPALEAAMNLFTGEIIDNRVEEFEQDGNQSPLLEENIL